MSTGGLCTIIIINRCFSTIEWFHSKWMCLQKCYIVVYTFSLLLLFLIAFNTPPPIFVEEGG